MPSDDNIRLVQEALVEKQKPAPHWIDTGTPECTELWRHFVDVYHAQTVFCDRRTGWWYHCDETFGNLRGPFHTRREAEESCLAYAEGL